MASKSATESEDEVVGGLDGDGLLALSGMVIAIRDGARGSGGGIIADGMNLPSDPRSGRHLDARTSRNKRDEIIVL